MDKRYQVFVSSTYADLVDERRHVIQTLMEMDCIPAVMELFPAFDEQQWAFIKRVINDCDYYVLIIGGRYGSTTAEGISFTEKEYDYAVERGLKVHAFIHGSPDEIPVGKSDIQPEVRVKLADFKTKVRTGRLVKFWTTANELPGMVALSLQKTIKAYPAVGWVRANQVASSEAVGEINALIKRVRELEQELNQAAPKIPDLAGLDEEIVIAGSASYPDQEKRAWSFSGTWRKLFGIIAPRLLEQPADMTLESYAAKELFSFSNSVSSLRTPNFIRLKEQDFQTIKVQLEALGLVNVVFEETDSGKMGLFWKLTPYGRSMLTQIRAVRSTTPLPPG